MGLFFLAILLPVSVAAMSSVVCNNDKCTLYDTRVAGATAWGEHRNTVNSTGWGVIEIWTDADAADSDQAYAAGYLEGALTRNEVADHLRSYMEASFPLGVADPAYQKAVDFVVANDRWVQEMVASNRGSGFWDQVGLLWAQLDGLVAGNGGGTGRLGFLLINALVDLSSVIHRPFTLRTLHDVLEYLKLTTHCSALVRVTPDLGDLYTSHNSWTGYYTMLRAMKRYHLAFHSTAAKSMVFSSYYGSLSSQDDFTVIDTNMVVQETTNGVFNDSLLATITPRAVLTWARSVVANRNAVNGSTWVTWFSEHNSGTVNNQWMVVDYKRFTPRHPLLPGTLTVLEQLPGLIRWDDVTGYLSLGYWPSYNSPFFAEVRTLAGWDDMVARFGDGFTYALNPRAKIFRRDVGKVTSREAMKALMRYNNWKHDPFAAAGYGGVVEPRSPENQIASRYDLIPRDEPQTRPVNRSAFGCIDAKLTSYADVLSMRVEAISGPTHAVQPVFSWLGEWRDSPHHGQPTTFNFSFVNFTAAS